MSLELKMRLNGATKNLLGEHSVSYRLDAVTGEELLCEGRGPFGRIGR